MVRRKIQRLGVTNRVRRDGVAIGSARHAEIRRKGLAPASRGL
jgi:hypothetical protein